MLCRMIVLVCTDDRVMAAGSRQHSELRHATYGDTVSITDDDVDAMAVDEDLFIGGWGSLPREGTEGNPTVGNRLRGGTRYDAVALWRRLVAMGIFPDAWRGRVYLWVNGAREEHPQMELSFAELFQTQVDVGAKSHGGVYARTTRIEPHEAELQDSVIPPPTRDVWTHI
jgi:hypothetical protein